MKAWPGLPLGTAGALLADDEIASLWTAEAEIAAILRFERALARAQFDCGLIDEAALAAIEAACVPDALDLSDLADGMRRDGVVVPGLVRQIKSRLGEAHADRFHLGATSQDAVDTATMMRLSAAIAILGHRLGAIGRRLETLAEAHGTRRMMARTRYQDALPFLFRQKVETWAAPLLDLGATAPSDFPLQLGGPIGLREEAFGPHHGEIARRTAAGLGLSDPRPRLAH